MKISDEDDNYAIVKKDGYVDYNVFHVTEPNGLIAYIEAGIIDIE